MSTAVNIEVTKSRLPLNFTDTPLNTLLAFIKRSKFRLTNVLFGSTELGPKPNDIGAWLPTPVTPDIPAWYYWNPAAGENQPLPIAVFNSGYHVVANANPSDNRTVTFHLNPTRHIDLGFDSSNTIAYLEDLYIPRDTVIFDTVSTNSITVEASEHETWLFKLHQDTDVTVNDLPQGKGIVILVMDEEGGHALTWAGSPTIQWPGGSPPPMPTGSGSVTLAEFRLKNINGTKYGYQVDRTPAIPKSSYTIPPVQRNYGGGGGSPRGVTKVLIQ